jgi:hypothetical protein
MLGNLNEETEKIKEQVTSHWESTMSKHKVCNSEIEAVSQVLIQEIQKMASRMMKENDKQATRIGEK